MKQTAKSVLAAFQNNSIVNPELSIVRVSERLVDARLVDNCLEVTQQWKDAWLGSVVREDFEDVVVRVGVDVSFVVGSGKF